MKNAFISKQHFRPVSFQLSIVILEVYIQVLFKVMSTHIKQSIFLIYLVQNYTDIYLPINFYILFPIIIFLIYFFLLYQDACAKQLFYACPIFILWWWMLFIHVWGSHEFVIYWMRSMYINPKIASCHLSIKQTNKQKTLQIRRHFSVLHYSYNCFIRDVNDNCSVLKGMTLICKKSLL